MRISDWSSDVCSSDLGVARDRQQVAVGAIIGPGVGEIGDQRKPHRARRRLGRQRAIAFGLGRVGEAPEQVELEAGDPALQREVAAARRSEEHTSELQSLMRTSYAVLCLKKKTN